MNNQDQLPTIAELWDRFQKLGNYIETEKFLQSWGTKGSDGLSHDGRNHSADEIELQALRQQLLERCRKDWGMFYTGDDEPWATSPKIKPMGLDAAKLKEIGSACNFMAWELEQREKERKGD